VRKKTQESSCEKVVLRNPKMPIKQQQKKITKEKKTIKKTEKKNLNIIAVLLLLGSKECVLYSAAKGRRSLFKRNSSFGFRPCAQ
jgi:hypothetical protein